MRCWKLPVEGLVLLLMATSGAQTPGAADAPALDRDGRYAEAAQAWQAMTEKDPRNAVAFASLGLDLAREGQYADAVTAYRRALALQPHMHGLELDLGLALFKEGKLEEATGPLKAAAAADPQSAQARILLGMSYYGTARYGEAVPYLRSAVEKAPENQELRAVLAQACLYAKQYNCTLEQYKLILAANPDSAQAHMLAGEALDGMNHTVEAIGEFEAAEKAGPREPNVHFGLGYLEWKEHRYPEAEAEFRLELENDPHHSQALGYLGDTEMKLGQKAEADLRLAVAEPGAIPLAWLDLGIVLAAEGKRDEAAADFEQAIRMDPKGVDAHWRLARLLQSEGKTAEARVEFAKAAALHEQEDKSLVEKMTPRAQP
jgi:tetratricopeptide (TPR) repeat protein